MANTIAIRHSDSQTATLRRSPLVLILMVAGTLLVSTGCYLPIFNGPPGTIGMQRSRAVLFDPFPSNTLGPPIQGGRPRGFDLPLSDVTTAQSNPNARPPARGF